MGSVCGRCKGGSVTRALGWSCAFMRCNCFLVVVGISAERSSVREVVGISAERSSAQEVCGRWWG